MVKSLHLCTILTVLYCIDTKRNRRRFYVGFTDNYKKRVVQHKHRLVNSTKSFDKFELVYFEMCLNKTDARRRELQLKTGFGRGYIKRRLENYLKSARV